MKTILAPTDFSKASLNAVNYAADLAVSVNAELVLFNIVQIPMIAVSEINLPESVINDLVELSARDLEELVIKLKKRTLNKIPITSEALPGSVEQQIESIASREKPLAIVMGTKPGKSFERALMGSTIFHTINHIPYPLLIIPENLSFSQINKIGVACDFKNIADSLPSKTIKEWLTLFNARLDIVYVTLNNSAFDAGQLSESIALQNTFIDYKPQFHFLEGSNLSDELTAFAKQQRTDLMIIMPRTYGILRIFHKKHTKELLSHLQFPVLAIHELPSNHL